ncbi:hypothetical protein SAMN04487909_14650 [Aneurinibacillus migulanus]|uniref:Uncharacterized protein n=2 Tax=Aneurinibacillus migulanus TaxID=47500 RepID=A0A1G9AIT5_ANEMI|nr:hypothetical protein SAMN04487909_14650 [Aneurinibacillus migulanus]
MNHFHKCMQGNPVISSCLLSPCIPPSNGTSSPSAGTTGLMFRHPSTDVIVVSLFNQAPDLPQTVTVSVSDWQNTCTPTEFNKFAFLCGDILNPPGNGNGNGNGNGIVINNGPGPFSPPVGFLPFTTPVTIPPRRNLIIHAYPPDPVLPPSPLYEVVVNPLHPIDPILPPDPIRPPVIVNTWGITVDGIIQEGNTVLHRQFVPAFSIA